MNRFKQIVKNQAGWLIVANLLVAVTLAASPRASDKPLTEIERDIAYGKAANQRLDIYPSGHPDKMPVMIYIHGGGWRKGDKANVGNKPAFFKSKGWVFISINYRLVPQIEFPKNVEDVACAIDWVYQNIGEYGGDPAKIFIMGHSAGAHLAALVATDSTYLEKYGRTLHDIKGVIPLDSQAYDLVEMLDDWSSEVYTGAFGTDPLVHKLASPQHHVEAAKSIPPFLVCYSKGVQVESRKRALRAKTFASKLEQEGVRVELVDATDRNHGQINQWFGLVSDTRVTDKAWRFLDSIVSDENRSGWEKSLIFDREDSRVRPVNAMNMTIHKGKLYCGMATSMEKDRFSGLSSYVFVKESADSEWKLDADFGPRTSRVGAMESIRFEFDANGKRIEKGPVEILVAFTLKLERGKSTLQARIRDDGSGEWLDVDLPVPRVRAPNVRCMALHREQVTGAQILFVGASPSPLGIVKGVYDPEVPGWIRWLPDVEMESTSGVGEGGPRGKWFGMASVNGKLFASSAKRIFRRMDGPEWKWIEVANLSSQEDITSAPPRGLTAVPTLNGSHSWEEPEMLLFSAAGRMWRMRVPDDPTAHHTLHQELNIMTEVSATTGEQVVFAEGAFNRIRFCPEAGGFWPIGFQIVYGKEGVRPRVRDPRTFHLKPEAWYFVRNMEGSYRLEKIEDGQRNLFLARDFEISPFGDHALYACGFNGSYFKGSLGSAWVYRREFQSLQE